MKATSAGRRKASPPVAPPDLHARLRVAFRILLYAYACLAAVPLRYHPIGTGLDPSWAYAINYAHVHRLLFGTDAGFTYGPLAYLIMPMPVGANLAAGILFQLSAWIAFCAVLAWFTFRRRISTVALLLFTVGVLFGADSFRAFGYAGVDNFLVFLTLLLLGGTLIEPRWILFYSAALVLTALLFYIKFSSAISAMSAIVVFTAPLVLHDRRKVWQALLALAAWPPLVLAIGCVVLEPSFAACGRYVRLGLDISSGYSTTMSAYGPPAPAINALLILAAWVIASAVLYWRGSASWTLAVACIGPLFLEFKHSFVREAGHLDFVFLLLPLAWALVALFTEWRKRDAGYLAAAWALLAILWYPAGYLWIPRLWRPAAVLHESGKLVEILHYSQVRSALEQQSAASLAADRLPPELLARVGDRSIAPFPWECAYAAANPLDARPFPLFQMYQAYTPFLDGLNAAFLDGARRGPAFVLFDWQTIDNRHPLLDVPATALAMYRHYDFDGLYGDHMLLRRRDTPRTGDWRIRETRTMRLDQSLHVPSADHALAARIYLRWNPRGQLLKFFFRVPEVRLIAAAAGGRVLNARVPPEVMQDGVPLNFLPFDAGEVRAVFSQEPVPSRIETISIGGPGAQYLQPEARVEIMESPERKLTFAPSAAPDFSRLRHLGTLDSWRIEMLNDTGAVGFSRLIVPETRGYVEMRGWAVIGNEAAGAVWMELDGKLRPAWYGEPRRDIAALFGRADDLPCGFTATIPQWELGKSWHELSLRILTRDHSGYYDGGRTLRFKME